MSQFVSCVSGPSISTPSDEITASSYCKLRAEGRERKGREEEEIQRGEGGGRYQGEGGKRGRREEGETEVGRRERRVSLIDKHTSPW